MAAELHGRVQIGPYVDDMPAAYMLADVVVSTGGARQGFSRTLVEAQAMGRPVVAEDGGGAAESVLPGVTGWLAPAGDPAALAEALQSALSLTTERRAEVARAAQEQVRSRYASPRPTGSCCSSTSAWADRCRPAVQPHGRGGALTKGLPHSISRPMERRFFTAPAIITTTVRT